MLNGPGKIGEGICVRLRECLCVRVLFLQDAGDKFAVGAEQEEALLGSDLYVKNLDSEQRCNC